MIFTGSRRLRRLPCAGRGRDDRRGRPRARHLEGDAAKAGEPLDAFIKSSIVDPGAFVASGYSDGVMPTTFGTTLSASDINDLVAFISASQK